MATAYNAASKPAAFAPAATAGATVFLAIDPPNAPSHRIKPCLGEHFLLEDGEVSLQPGKGSSTFAQATFNCISLLLGLGVVTSPYAIAQTGWLGAMICVAVAGVNGYAAELMVRCQKKTGCGTYQELAKKAVGKKTQLLIAILFNVQLIGTVLGYCISVADNLDKIFPTSTLSLPGLKPRDILLLVAFLCVLPTVWMRNLAGLSIVSLWSIIASLLLILTVFLSATVADHIGFHHSIPFANIKAAPIAIGLYSFAFSGAPIFPTIYTSMKDPSKFTQVMVLSFSICTVLVFGLGVAGASMFGKETSSQVTLNMPSHRTTTKIVLWTTVLTPILKFSLTLSPMLQAMDIWLQKRFKKYSTHTCLYITTLSRSCILALIIIVAILLPIFNYVVALIGSSVIIAICILFPCIFYFNIFRDRLTRHSLALILLTCTISIVAAVCGTIMSFKGIVVSKQHPTGKSMG